MQSLPGISRWFEVEKREVVSANWEGQKGKVFNFFKNTDVLDAEFNFLTIAFKQVHWS